MKRYTKWLWLLATTVTLAACAGAVPVTPSPVIVRGAPSTAAPIRPSQAMTATAAAAYPPPDSYTLGNLPGGAEAYPGSTAVPLFSYRIINQYPHDPTAFTQGLVYLADEFYESTGLYGQSSLRRIRPDTGEVLQMLAMPEQFFGEGVVIWQDRIIQITWKEHTAFVYDRETFEIIGEHAYDTEGWGITHDGRQLIMSDGSSTLFFRDPETFAETGRVQVWDGDTAVTQLNELEYVNGEVWANIWHTDSIARIDPKTGQVVGWVDLTGLLDGLEITQAVDVLNGIAYDAAGNRLFVTGKLWPALFEIEVVPVDS